MAERNAPLRSRLRVFILVLALIVPSCGPERRDPPAVDFGPLAAGTLMSRGELLAQIQGRLDQLAHIRRDPSSPGGIDDLPETLAAAEAKLSRDDLLRIRKLLLALQKPPAWAEILRLGLDDRQDTTTEHGGVLDVDGEGRLVLTLVPPMLTGNDMEYLASDRAMAMAATHLAMFHFHFSQADSSEDAGPSVGDLRFAATQHVTCVVFTSLSETRFDVDYYTPEGAVVDLGIYNGRH